MQGTIICYGDSNTYGYDPRLGGGGDIPKRKDGRIFWQKGYDAV
jgi:hypothetical protein